MRVVVCIFAATAALFCGAAALADSDAEAVARARAELARRIEAAGVGGAIVARGAPQAPPGEITAPPLRNAENADCLTMATLGRTVARLEPAGSQALDDFRTDLLSTDGEGRTGAELALARAYLVLGFAEEAYAIAAARTGAEPAAITGLAALAGGADGFDLDAVREHRDCGALYDFILEASGSEGRPLSGASLRTLSALPPPLRQPIAETFAVNVLGSDEMAANDFLNIAAAASPSSASSFVNAVIDRSETGSATLAAFSATPGPHRAAALNALSERLDENAPEKVMAAFDADAAEAIEAAPLSRSIPTLNMALASRRIARGDVRGAARALGAAWRHDETRSAAIAMFSALMQPLLRSEKSSDRLLALEAAVTEPALAAESLSTDEWRMAAASLADLGAGKALAKVLLAGKAGPDEEAYFRARMLVHVGRIAEARAAAAHSKDTRAATLLLQTAYVAGDADFAKAGAASDVELPVISGAFWRTGDIAALMGLANAKPIDAATARRIAFAYLTGRKAPPNSLLAALKDEEGTAALFAPGPNSKTVKLRDIEQLDTVRKKEIAFLRAAVRDE
ncbi:MAG: hypothetical protein U5J99_08455 [Parvularculaceae bacterium]|nr:hypothetical protein [Parvularculaceae bacterium]